MDELISKSDVVKIIKSVLSPASSLVNVARARRQMLNEINELESKPEPPEIIRCRECKFASGDSRICMKFGHSPIGELDFCAWAERRTDE